LARWSAALLNFLAFLFESAFEAVLVEALLDDFEEAVPEAALAVVSVVTFVTVTVSESPVSAAAGWVPKAPTDADRAAAPRVTRARRDRLAGVVDRVAPRFFRWRLPG